MSLMADTDIERAMGRGDILIEPYDPKALGPASYDITLAPEYRTILGAGVLDTGDLQEGHTDLHEPSDMDGYPGIELAPGQLILATTAEKVRIGPGMAARVEGRSSLGRLGLLVHVSAGFIDPGFEGQITLEIVNLAPVPIVLRPGMRIAQLCFFHMTRTSRQSYGTSGHYQNQVGPTESRFKLHRALV